jgi:hypothetical protein
MYENREYIAAYERFKPVYDKVVTDMQRVLTRNADFEANKLARELRKPLPAAKEIIQKRKVHAQEVIEQIDRLRQDLESKPLVRAALKKGWSGKSAAAVAPAAAEETPPTVVQGAAETQLDAQPVSSAEIVVGKRRYQKAPYAPPEADFMYSVRDKARGERIIRVIDKSADGGVIQVETIDNGQASKQPISLAIESLARQAAKGWCSRLMPVDESAAKVNSTASTSQPAAAGAPANVTMRLDIQNFGRCCADIVRANIKFDTQLIKDVGDGPFRAGNFEQAFLSFEQFAVGFTSAVTSSRQAIAEGRRALTAEKGKLSGREIEERKAAFTRSEHLIHIAEREFSTILEGLRTYLRARQGGFPGEA